MPRGSHRWRVAAYQAEEIVDGAARRAGSGTAPAGRCCRSGWRTPSCCGWRRPATPPTTGCRTRWPGAARSSSTPTRSGRLSTRPGWCFRLLTDPEFLAEHADGHPHRRGAGAAALGQAPRVARRRRTGPWPTPCSIDEVADLVDRTPSPRPRGRWTRRRTCRRCSCARSAAAARPARRRCSATSRRAPLRGRRRSWDEALKHLGKTGAHTEQLTAGFRVPGEVIEYAARLLPSIAPHLTPPTAVRRARGELAIDRVPDTGSPRRSTPHGSRRPSSARSG